MRELVKVHQGRWCIRTLSFILGLSREPTGTHVQPSIPGSQTAEEAPDLRRADRCFCSMFHLDFDPRFLKAQTVRRRQNVDAAIGSFLTHSSLESHCAE